MRYFIFAIGVIWGMIGASVLYGFDIEARATFGPPTNDPNLRILSTADISYFEPMIASFLENNPDISIDYTVASSSQVMQAIAKEQAQFDLVISSAMDLQIKLANDGHALRHAPLRTVELPTWAHWNSMVFAFSQEPAAMVVSKQFLAQLGDIQTRQSLIGLIRKNPDKFRGRIGTYDIRRSGLGYLFATQDARGSETYWRLMEVMGQSDVQLYCCSSDMIGDVLSGKLDMAYNVLGSYAQRHPQADQVAIILPQDMTTVMLRSVLIPKTTQQPALAGLFLDHMLQRAFGTQTGAGHNLVGGQPSQSSAINRIGLGPGLLVFLDRYKKQRFLSEWESAILQ
jgi:iron(III) transport system substrate-binding protein